MPPRRGSCDSRPGHAEELFEHPLAQIRRNARALVGHVELARAVRRHARAESVIVRARRRVFAGVVEQDVDHLGDRRRRRPTGGGSPSASVDHRRDDRGSRVSARCQPGADDVVAHRRRADAAAAPRSARSGVRQPFDEAVQPIRFLVDHLQQLAPVVARRAPIRPSRLAAPMSAVTAALIAVSGVRRLCVSASSSAALSCSLRRAASASLARSNAAAAPDRAARSPAGLPAPRRRAARRATPARRRRPR